MWPGVVTGKDGIGKKFDEKFWDYWGPTNIFYFNQENLFNSKREIKSIYCMYLSCNQVEFNPDEFAMGVIYQCGDFGEHTILFGYDEEPNIKHIPIWDNIILENITADSPGEASLCNYMKWVSDGKITEEEAYMNYLENFLLLHNDKDLKNSLRKLSVGMVERYVEQQGLSDNEAYIKFLERISQKIIATDGVVSTNLKTRIRQAVKIGDLVEFCLVLSDVAKEKEIGGRISIQEKYQFDCETVKNFKKEKNDLNAIFEQCRDYLSKNVIKIVEKESENNKDIFPCYMHINGRIIRGEDGKAYFEENKDTKNMLKVQGYDDNYR